MFCLTFFVYELLVSQVADRGFSDRAVPPYLNTVNPLPPTFCYFGNLEKPRTATHLPILQPLWDACSSNSVQARLHGPSIFRNLPYALEKLCVIHHQGLCLCRELLYKSKLL